MTDQDYLSLRRLFFWIFFLGFLIFTPLIIFYSLGYKFDLGARKLEKTGAISIESSPKDATVFIDGVKVSDATPYMSRGLLPKTYSVVIQKNNYYPYQISADVRSAMVADVNATLIPQMQNVEKLLPSFNVLKFFVTPQLFGKRIIAFTDQGLYEMGENFENPQKFAALNLDETIIATISGLKENKNHVLFWNADHVWLVVPVKGREAENNLPQPIFTTGEMIKDVFWGLKGRYVIIHDALKIFALDIKNSEANFPLFALNSTLASSYYDSDTDVLYVKDRVPNTNKFSLFRIPLLGVINEKNAN